MSNPAWFAIPVGLISALLGVGHMTTARIHPDRPNARLSRGLGYVGIAIGIVSFVFGLLTATGVLVPPPMPQPPAAGAPAPGQPPAPASAP